LPQISDTLQLNAYSQEFPGDDSKKNVYKDVFHRTFELTRSNSAHEKLGAILAIGELAHGCMRRRTVLTLS